MTNHMQLKFISILTLVSYIRPSLVEIPTKQYRAATGDVKLEAIGRKKCEE